MPRADVSNEYATILVYIFSKKEIEIQDIIICSSGIITKRCDKMRWKPFKYLLKYATYITAEFCNFRLELGATFAEFYLFMQITKRLDDVARVIKFKCRS